MQITKTIKNKKININDKNNNKVVNKSLNCSTYFSPNDFDRSEFAFTASIQRIRIKIEIIITVIVKNKKKKTNESRKTEKKEYETKQEKNSYKLSQIQIEVSWSV